ncbi:MAG: SLATT domain-containing protein [Cyclobacteriaceae bacterium]|jgi:hypothetical protein
MGHLQKTYDSVIGGAKIQATWYEDKKKTISKTSRELRRWSIILVSFGGLFPLLGAASKQDIFGVDVTNWGYIAIALAGTLLLLDRYFGFSSAWIRYTTTKLEIEKLIKEFEIKWVMEVGDADVNTLDPLKMKELMKSLLDFSNLIAELVKQETNAWAVEFQNNIAELQKSINSKLQSSMPGAIKVSVVNTKNLTSLVLRLDQLSNIPITGNMALIQNVSPGFHSVTISGKGTDGQTIVIGDEATVEAGKLVSVELKLS